MAPAEIPNSGRITSIDALRGLVMATMIYVNDLAGAGAVVPDWMVHFSERHAQGSGLTFVDLVFPAFLFIVGMAIPIVLRPGAPARQTLGERSRRIAARVATLLFIGVLMVNESPDPARLGWSASLWSALLYVGAIAACCDVNSRSHTKGIEGSRRRITTLGLRIAGFMLLAFLAFAFVGPAGQRIVTLQPFTLHTQWWGILGLIGWAYLVGAFACLACGLDRVRLLATLVLLLCLYPAERAGMFDGFWLQRHLSIGSMLGSHAAIAVAGVFFSTTLLARRDSVAGVSPLRFALWFIAGCGAAAWLLHGLYGVSKNSATPSWCLWSCAATAGVWLMLHFISDVWKVRVVSRPLAVAGENVLLAYLLSQLFPPVLELLNLAEAYHEFGRSSLLAAVVRAIALAIVLLAGTAALNRVGFRVKL